MGSSKVSFYRKYDLIKARQYRSDRKPAAHQREALGKLQSWFQTKHSPFSGSILALPTGGGKTFTTVRFLASSVLAQPNYKVLWLAHTHHLLEQAFYSFGPKVIQEAQQIGRYAKVSGYEVGYIPQNRNHLAIRVVSGAPGYFPVRTIEADDDVLICTLQTITKGYKNKHPSLESYLDSIQQDRLFIVFDEAHHLPANSYRKLIGDLRKRFPGMYLLGLTATPTYHDERKRGWLNEFFPQGVVYRAEVDRLIADGVLANPNFEQPQRTKFKPQFDEEQYRKWVTTYQDLPENIITELAQSRERNEFIAQIYVDLRARYGKTIMFADRWFQCEQLKTFLEKRGVKAGAVYSHIDADPGNVEERNKRDRDENARVLERFKRNELDVLINIRMLTEGTDVPDAQTVFLTRQTTSEILLTQMIGRALRGPKFGGTKDAYIVSFIDDWEKGINWASFDLEGGTEDSAIYKRSCQQALELISIDRVVQLTRQQNQGIGFEQVPFLKLLPVGWYQISFEATATDRETLTKGSEDTQVVRDLVLVFDHEQDAYQKFIQHLQYLNLSPYTSEFLTIDDCHYELECWQESFFDPETHVGDDLMTDLFGILRHMAQNLGDSPKFFQLKERDKHDLDLLAHEWLEQDLSSRAIYQKLQSEYANPKRYWTSIYNDFEHFKFQYDACENRILKDRQSETGSSPKPPIHPFDNGKSPEPSEAPQYVKDRIKKRDRMRCLCCGQTHSLQVDHIKSQYFGGPHAEENLQTLCKFCNSIKDTQEINFRQSVSLLSEAPETPPKLSRRYKDWRANICQSINFFYQCSAVESIHVPLPLEANQVWKITLKEGINPAWLQPYLNTIEEQIYHYSNDKKQIHDKVPSPRIVIEQPLITFISK